MATFESSLKSKLIYVFAINDERHRDCLKVGETTLDEDDGSDLINNSAALKEAANKRIQQYVLRYNGGVGPYDSELVTVNKELIEKWKIITSRLTAEHAGETDKNGQKRIFSTLEMLEPGTICTETYMLLRTFDSKETCSNMLQFLKTRFVRALVAMATSTQQMSRANFRFVPLQDFTRPWTDADLYAKYHLTDDEIQFIESMIKPMD